MSKSTFSRRSFVAQAVGMNLLMSHGWKTMAAAWDKLEWKAALGMNGFASAIQKYGTAFEIEDILEFAGSVNFGGVELVENWPHPQYPSSSDRDAIKKLRDQHARHNLAIFSIQTGAGEAFSPDRSARENYVRVMRDRIELAEALGCSCIGMWPYGPLRGQSVDQAIRHLGSSFAEVARIAHDHGVVAAFETEPPFAFNKKKHWKQILDAASEPKLKMIYDPSHFDLMSGSTGRPHEMLREIGVENVGYVHFTDTDGTLRDNGTSKHLPVGDGHVDIDASFKTLRDGGFKGWLMIDGWEIPDPYDAGRKGVQAIDRFVHSSASEISAGEITE